MQHIGVIKLGKKTQKVQCGRKHTVKEGLCPYDDVNTDDS